MRYHMIISGISVGVRLEDHILRVENLVPRGLIRFLEPLYLNFIPNFISYEYLDISRKAVL